MFWITVLRVQSIMVGKSQQPGLAVGGHFEFIIEK